MIRNKIKVMLQQMMMKGYVPWKLLMSKGICWALREECQGMDEYKATDKAHFYGGLQIVIDNSVVDPIILCKPEYAKKTLEESYATN